MNDLEFTGLMKFWRDVEALTPRDIPKLAPNDKEPTKNWQHDDMPPWTDPNFLRRRIPDTHTWKHGVYACLFDSALYIKMIENLLGKQNDVFEERSESSSCVFFVSVGNDGRPLPETFMLSMSAWAFGIIETMGIKSLDGGGACDIDGLHVPDIPLDIPPSNSGFAGFDKQLKCLREELAWRIGGLPEGSPMDNAMFADFTSLVIKKCKLENLVVSNPAHRIKSIQIRKPKPVNTDNAKTVRTDDDFLNSFFIKDLNRIKNAGLGGIDTGLKNYIEGRHVTDRVDVRRDRDYSLNLLSPDNFPQGCWPSEHPLVWSQQVAVNALWKNLRKSSGIFGVNGPPGTGKTTLLRDVVAAIIVERAKVLADLGCKSIGNNKKSIKVGTKHIPYYDLAEAISGFSIVVASSNNGAVENVTLELPKSDAIHSSWGGCSNAYPDIASNLLGEPAWALIAGKLGNKQNRTDFVSKLWWGDKIVEGEDNSKKIPGLRHRLNAISNGEATPSISWDDAVAKFKGCLKKEQEIRTNISQLRATEQSLHENEQELVANKARLEQCERKKVVTIATLNTLNASLPEVAGKLAQAENKLNRLHTIRPGIMDWFSDFGKSHKAWRKSARDAVADIDKITDEQNNLVIQIKQSNDCIEQHDDEFIQLSATEVSLTTAITKGRQALKEARSFIGAKHWPDLSVTDDELEKTSPWSIQQWRDARIKVLLAALDIHRAFIESNASTMLSNLGLAMDVLSGAVQDSHSKKAGMDSLALVCPVISTTFASVSNLFGEMAIKSIGWLLIDEAGQAPPQAAAGAIWRAQRSIVVGDPLQLEPVVTIPVTIESALANFHGGVEQRMFPTQTSTQKLADAATLIGTLQGKGDESLWVGAPLCVHRRCDVPMFSISNEIAYDGMMVHHKSASDISWPKSYWVDVPMGQADGNWIADEGIALDKLLAHLIGQHQIPSGDIFLISPFREVVKQLYAYGKRYSLDDKRVGTVHTTQGKEADVVIMVLGGGTHGAKNWAAEKPNLLNVAVSRAKKRIYVIGDRSEWRKREYFKVLSRQIV